MVATTETVGKTPDTTPDVPKVHIRMTWDTAVGIAAALHAAQKALATHPDAKARGLTPTVAGLSEVIAQACAGIANANAFDGSGDVTDAYIEVALA